MTNPTLAQLSEEIEKEFDALLERMRAGGFGKKVSLDGRMIWDVGGDDESSYVFADETLKRFINSALKKVAQATYDAVKVEEKVPT